MNVPITIPLIDGGGFYKINTGRTVTLRIDPYSSNLYTATEIGSGDYIFNGVTEYHEDYKLYVDGVVQDWFGVQILGTNTSLMRKADGTWDGQNIRLRDIADPVTDVDVGDRGYNDARYAQAGVLQYVWWIVGKNIFVDSNIGIGDDHHYNNIQSAINFGQSSLSPSATSRVKIYILEDKNPSGGGYVENITLQPYIDLIGIGKPKITGSISGMNLNTRLENLFWNYGGNLNLSAQRALNCVFRIYQPIPNGGYTLTLTNNKLDDCKFFSKDGSSPKIVSAGGNIFYGTNICNAPFTADETDVGILSSFNDASIDYVV